MSDKPPEKHAGKPPSKGPPPTPSGAPLSLENMIFMVAGVIVAVSLIGFALSLLSQGGSLGDVWSSVHSFIVTIASIIALVTLPIIIYSMFQLSAIRKEENEKLGLAFNWDQERTMKNERWHRVEDYMTSNNPSDWKIAVLEADNLLDEIVERLGYKGDTLGERLKNIEASDFPYLDEAWQAHKVRNNVAHKGTNFELSRSEAEHTVNIYNRIFKALGYL